MALALATLLGRRWQAHGASCKHRYAKAGWWNPLAKFAFPIIGGLSLDEIEISHITAILLRAERAGAPDTARRVRSRIELVLNAAIAQGLRTATLINPASGKLIGNRPGAAALLAGCAVVKGVTLGLALRSRRDGWEGSRGRAPTALEQGREGADRRRGAGARGRGERGRPAARRSSEPAFHVA